MSRNKSINSFGNNTQISYNNKSIIEKKSVSIYKTVIDNSQRTACLKKSPGHFKPKEDYIATKISKLKTSSIDKGNPLSDYKTISNLINPKKYCAVKPSISRNSTQSQIKNNKCKYKIFIYDIVLSNVISPNSTLENLQNITSNFQPIKHSKTLTSTQLKSSKVNKAFTSNNLTKHIPKHSNPIQIKDNFTVFISR